MKKTLPIAIFAASLLGLGSLSSCHDEDFDVSTAVLQERAFEQNFIKEFGKPSANQSWDFYSQKMQSIRQEAGLTRGIMAEGDVVTPIKQPKDNEFFKGLIDEWHYALAEQNNNSNVGTNSYSLVSTGDFKIYAVRYAGGIEVNSGQAFNMVFGIRYLQGDDYVYVPIFYHGFNTEDEWAPTDPSPGSNTPVWGNPGWGAEVKIPADVTFDFYFTYTYHFDNNSRSETQWFYSNESPTFYYRRFDNGTSDSYTYTNYGGCTTLLYTSSHIVDETTGAEEQVMMVGLEDAFGLVGRTTVNGHTYNTNNYLDYDFNDVVILIEGELPVPTSKRFFVEDKSSFDWDYNDVVFDVASNGITLRAVGGTLPVWMEVTDRHGNVNNLNNMELHELMRSLQVKPKKPSKSFPDNTVKPLTYVSESDGKTYYKPIDVASDPGMWLEPVRIVTWTRLPNQTEAQGTRLTDKQVENFANALAGEDKVGDIKLIIGSEYGQTKQQALALAQPNEDGLWENGKELGKSPKIVQISDLGGIPAMWSGPVSVNWSKELKKITYGYPLFYNGTATVDGETKRWWEYGTNNTFWYLYYDDVDPDAPYPWESVDP